MALADAQQVEKEEPGRSFPFSKGEVLLNSGGLSMFQQGGGATLGLKLWQQEKTPKTRYQQPNKTRQHGSKIAMSVSISEVST